MKKPFVRPTARVICYETEILATSIFVEIDPSEENEFDTDRAPSRVSIWD